MEEERSTGDLFNDFLELCGKHSEKMCLKQFAGQLVTYIAFKCFTDAPSPEDVRTLIQEAVNEAYRAYLELNESREVNEDDCE